MLLATVLSALLMGGVLLMTATIGRDRARLAARESASRQDHLIDQLRWDLTNAATMTQSENGRALILIGHGGLDPQTLAPTGRLSRVVYEVRGMGRDAALFRSQTNLDEPAHSQPWTEIASLGVTTLYITAQTSDGGAIEREAPSTHGELQDPEQPAIRRKGPPAYHVPTRARIHIERGAEALEQEIWLR